MIKLTAILLLTSLQILASSDFPVTGKMRTRVDFWKKVYTEISTTEAFIHDSSDLSIIYKKVTLPSSRRLRRKEQKREKNLIRALLRSIAKKNYNNLTDKEKEIIKIIGNVPRKKLYQMARNVRYQYGLKDRYYKGLQRSYAYIDYIKQTLKNKKIPEELAYLPHVESSFNYQAYSKVGAAGIWQFMRGTARNYGLKVGYIIDERRDPIKATKSAAKLLRDNYRTLKSWPLALTAYNHGPRSIKRAIKKVGSRDINTIIEKYNGRRFGFASKNFYATFMATVEISRNPEQYFPKFKRPPVHSFFKFKLDRPYTVRQLTNYLGIKRSVIKKFNPSIRRVAYRSQLYLPKGYFLKIPVHLKNEIGKYKEKLAAIKQTPSLLSLDKIHVISKGESLYDISRIYRVKIKDLIAFNRISNPSRIYPGKRIKIPGKKKIMMAKIVPTPKTNITKKTAIDLENTEVEPIISTQPIDLKSYNLSLKPIKKNIYELTVETEETLGHYADWAKIRTQKIRNQNNLRFKSTIHLNQKIKTIISDERVEQFKEMRNRYHMAIQEDFYSTYKITGKKEYTVRIGDTLSRILKKFDIPYWLLRTYQPSRKLNSNIMINQKIVIPIVEPAQEI